MPKAISISKARQILSKTTPSPQVETVSLKQARGRVLAQQVKSDLDMPPFDKAMMDGYAVRAGDTRHVPVWLQLIEEIPAGAVPKQMVRSGTCSRIMTGAPMPRGADAVVQVEHTQETGNRISIRRGVPKGKHVALRAEDIRRGDLVLRKGTLLRAGELGILATVGCARPKVYRQPTCALIVTGDELVAPSQKPRPGQIRNSNAFSLGAQLADLGLSVEDLGVARDRESSLRQKIRQGLQRDVLFLSGGVSAGKWDLVIPVLESLGVRQVLYQVRIRPGRPLYIGKRGRTRVFALPGNPVSTFVLFEVFVRPFLYRMMGSNAGERPRLRMKLAASIRRKAPRVQFLPASIRNEHVKPLSWHGSADLFALSRTDAFVVVPANTTYRQGAPVEVMKLS